MAKRFMRLQAGIALLLLFLILAFNCTGLVNLQTFNSQHVHHQASIQSVGPRLQESSEVSRAARVAYNYVNGTEQYSYDPAHSPRGLFGSREWRRKKQTGKNLKCLMTQFQAVNIHAVYTFVAELQYWGWRNIQPPERQRTTAQDHNDPVLSLLVPFHQGLVYSWKHQERSRGASDDGKWMEYPATNAEYKNAYWPQDGVIMALDNYGPQYHISRKQTEMGESWDGERDAAPQLSHWSDVVYITWREITTEAERSNLRFVLVRNFINQETKDALAHVPQRQSSVGRRPKPPFWLAATKGSRITSSMDGFDVLLSAPNVRGVCVLLIQHRQDLGHKTIKSITAYPEPVLLQLAPNLLIEIGDVDRVYL